MLFYSKAITSVKLSYKLMFVFTPARVDDILERVECAYVCCCVCIVRFK